MLMWPLYRSRTNGGAAVVVNQDGGGGDRRRKDEMSVEQWRLRNRQLAEDDDTIMDVIGQFLKGIQ